MYLISKFVFPDHPGGFQFRSITEHFITAVIVAPIIETYIFQKGIIDFTRLTIKASKLISVLLSATAFAFTHTYSIQYVAVTFILGMLYGIIYLSFIEKKADAFWHLTIIHALYNLFAFVMNNFILSHI
ncbi:lysostaphin resistance A-like protein [Flavitalea sp.]|nr:CPBP family intramembrane glutamic endopeptidase [Flavitalea sp.]